jgi:hypothetical protein
MLMASLLFGCMRPLILNVGPESFERIAEQAMETVWMPFNPRRVEGPAQVREILQLAA